MGEEPAIKIDLNERVYEDMDWIHLAQDRDQWLVPMGRISNIRVL
jgi:hypothetical protein